MFGAMGLTPAIDFTTVEFLGNTGSAALPVTMAIGIEQGRLKRDDRVACSASAPASTRSCSPSIGNAARQKSSKLPHASAEGDWRSEAEVARR